MGGGGYLNSLLSCAFPPRSPPKAHPSWQLHHMDIGQYSEKISRAGVFPASPQLSADVGLKALMGKVWTKGFWHRVFRSFSPCPFQLLLPHKTFWIYCFLSKGFCSGMSTPATQPAERGGKGLRLTTVLGSIFKWQVGSESQRWWNHHTEGFWLLQKLGPAWCWSTVMLCPGAGLGHGQDRPWVWEF